VCLLYEICFKGAVSRDFLFMDLFVVVNKHAVFASIFPNNFLYLWTIKTKQNIVKCVKDVQLHTIFAGAQSSTQYYFRLCNSCAAEKFLWRWNSLAPAYCRLHAVLCPSAEGLWQGRVLGLKSYRLPGDIFKSNRKQTSPTSVYILSPAERGVGGGGYWGLCCCTS
jgi:hypothetical protein